jgi:hypothetical protein
VRETSSFLRGIWIDGSPGPEKTNGMESGKRKHPTLIPKLSQTFLNVTPKKFSATEMDTHGLE